MVKKLLKYELMYYLRTLGLFLPIVLVIGLVTKIFIMLDGNNALSSIAIGSSVLMLAIACAAIVMLSTVVSIIRFYKNMYSSEGYLTFALPITCDQHIFVKLLSSLICQLVCLVTAVVAVVIAISGETLNEVVDLLSYGLRDFFTSYGTANSIGFIIEAVLILSVTAVSNVLLFYTCITVGQTARKNRVLMAIVAYFVYYVITQTIGTVFAITVTVLESIGALDALDAWFSDHYALMVHSYLCIAIVFSAVLIFAFWFVTKKIMSKKLNLE